MYLPFFFLSSTRPTSHFPTGLGIQKIRTFLSFFDKKHSKKLVFFHAFVNQFNQACAKQDNYFFFFLTPYIFRFLELIKAHNIIFNYQKIPSAYLFPLLLFKTQRETVNRVGLVFFSVSPTYGLGVRSLKLLSRPSRYIYVSKNALVKLLSVRRVKTFNIFVLNTTHGILVHSEALKRGVGGNLICIVN